MKSKRDQHYRMADGNPTSVQDLSAFVETTMQNLQGKFQVMSNQIVSRMDEMGTRIDDLEKNVSDLMTLAGMDEPVEDSKQ